MKICSKCKETKEYKYFCADKKSKDGYQSWCKVCKIPSVANSPTGQDKEYQKKHNKYKSTDATKERLRRQHHKNKVARNISRRIRQSLNGKRKSVTWTQLVDYTLDQLKEHLENKFVDNMSWENYGEVWHIDHIRPIKSFNINSTECDEFKSCWSLNNLQPLFVEDNLKKSDTYVPIV